uniref:(northern house mosquito) hypothetical protein n=1 Tax=Culex pipiens TaxID=7175 RepID=A0A8D8A5S9_CULPI
MRKEKVRREWKSLVSIWCQSDKIFFSDVYPRVQHNLLHSELELISLRSVVSDKSPRKFDLFPKPQYNCVVRSRSLPLLRKNCFFFVEFRMKKCPSSSCERTPSCAGCA